MQILPPILKLKKGYFRSASAKICLNFFSNLFIFLYLF